MLSFDPTEHPEDAERKRRLHLNQIGRIAEGQVVELAEHAPEPPAPKKVGLDRARVPSLTMAHGISSLIATLFLA